MRQVLFKTALIGPLVAALLVSPTFGFDAAQAKSKVHRASNTTAGASGDVSPETSSFEVSDLGRKFSAPSAAGGEPEVIWDNGFDGPFGPAILAHAYSSADPLEADFIIADDYQLIVGSEITGFVAAQSSFGGDGSLDALVDTYVVTFWEDAGGSPSNTRIAEFIVTDLEFTDQGGFFDVEGNFPAGQSHIASGNVEWVSISAVLPFPPRAATVTTTDTFGSPLFQTAFEPAIATPWNDAMADDDGNDAAFQLLGFGANGGQTVVTFDSVGNSAGCSIRVTPTTADSGCGAGDAGPCERSFGNSCFVTVEAAPLTAIAVLGIRNELNNVITGGSCGEAIEEAIAVGPHLILTTNDGPRPDVCIEQVSGVVTQLGTLGSDCRVEACGYELGIGPAEVLPSIAGNDNGGIGDRLTTSKTCDDGAGGTTQQLDLAAGALDIPGLPSSDAISATLRMSGVARDFATEDSDTRIARLADVVFGDCSGDFSRPGGADGVFAPDGVVDANDTAQFAFCQANPGTGDCSRFDFDGNGSIDGNIDGDPEAGQVLDDAATLRCLEASGNSADCCPSNTSLPQNASTPTNTAITRLHLRSCEYLEVTRAGQIWPENWLVDVYLSGLAPQIGGSGGGTCIDDADVEDNDVIDNAADIGLVSSEDALTVAGTIGNSATCDDGIGFGGDNDGDLYRFSLGFSETVNISVGDPGDCSGGSTAAITSVWLFNESGVLVASQDNGAAGSPAINASLDSGLYYVLVAGGGLVAEPVATAVACSIGAGLGPELFDPNSGLPLDITGDYELSLSVAPRSTINVTQETADAGQFDSTLLVQPLITLQRIGDPFQSVLIDTGELGEDATVLTATDVPYVNSLSPELADVLVPEDDNFIPGVRDNGGSQSVEPFSLSGTGYSQQLEPPTRRKCGDVEFGCAYAQLPLGDARNGVLGVFANFIVGDDFMADFTIADNFVLDEDGMVSSVSFWVLDDDNDGGNDVVANGTVFRLRFLGDTALAGACDGPDESNVLSEGVDGQPIVRAGQSAIWDEDGDGDDDVSRVTLNLAEPFMATAGTTYWVELQWDGEASDLFVSGAPIFIFSNEGDGTYFQDIDPAAEAVGAGCPDADLIGNGYDCIPTEDDPATMDCNEADPSGDLEPSPLLADKGEEVEPTDIALCISLERAEAQTKDLPFDVACGSWREQNGAIIWNQPFGLQEGGTIGLFSDIDFGADGVGIQVADDFTPRSDVEITGIRWSGGYNVNVPTQPDDFRVEFYSDTGDGIPGSVIRIFPAAAPELIVVPGELSGDPGRQVFDYFFKLPLTQAVQANETLWLSIVNDTTGAGYTWFWAVADGADTNGVAASRNIEGGAGAWNELPAEVDDDPTDLAFDVLVDGANRIIAGDAVDSGQLGTVGSGLGYRFDTEFCYINGLQGKNLSESTGNRWNKVRAPWKFFNEFAGEGALPVAEAGDLIEDAGISSSELSALTRNVPGEALVEATFAGLAAYDAGLSTNAIQLGGSVDRVCNGALVDEVDPNVALNDRLPVKGILWDDGTTTFIAGGGGPPPLGIQILHANGLPGETRPFSGYIDPREDVDFATQAPTGIMSAEIVFSTSPFGDAGGSAVTTANFTIRETGGGTPPTITGVNCSGSTCTVEWDRPITLQEWTTIEASVFDSAGTAIESFGDMGDMDEPDRIDLAALPCDVDQGGSCTPLDLFSFRQFVLNMNQQPANGTRADLLNMDRDPNGDVGPLDLFRLRQLINGVATTQSWGLPPKSLNNPRP